MKESRERDREPRERENENETLRSIKKEEKEEKKRHTNTNTRTKKKKKKKLQKKEKQIQTRVLLVPHKVAQQVPQLAHVGAPLHQPQLATCASYAICCATLCGTRLILQTNTWDQESDMRLLLLLLLFLCLFETKEEK